LSRWFFALACGLAFVSVTGAGPAGRPGLSVVRVVAAGHAWEAHVQAPPGHDGETPLPVVLLLHGAGGSGGAFLDDAGWSAEAARSGFLAVAPTGLPAKPELGADFLNNPRLWNSGQFPPDRPRSRVDDLAFLDALLDEVARRWPVDPLRVYAAGHSNGGALAFRLAAERSERFAAVASVAGLCHLTDPRPTRPVPTLLIAGLDDPILPFKGGTSVLPWEVRKTPPVVRNVRRWAKALGCRERPLRHHFDPKAWSQDYGPAEGDVRFRALFLVGQGHGWPGGRETALRKILLGPNPKTVDATAYVWKFLSGHALPGPAVSPRQHGR